MGIVDVPLLQLHPDRLRDISDQLHRIFAFSLRQASEIEAVFSTVLLQLRETLLLLLDEPLLSLVCVL